MVKPGRQSHPHSWAIGWCLALNKTSWLTFILFDDPFFLLNKYITRHIPNIFLGKLGNKAQHTSVTKDFHCSTIECLTTHSTASCIHVL